MDKEKALFNTESSEESDSSNDGKPSRKRKRILGQAAVEDKQSKRDTLPEKPKEEKSDESWLAKFAEKPEQEESKAEKNTDVGETVSEAEAPADGTLSPEEEKTVIQAIAEEASHNLPEHDASEQPEEAAGDMLVAEFYEKLEENPDIEAAAKEAAGAAGVELPDEEIAEALPEEGEVLTQEEIEEALQADEELVFDRTAEALPVEVEDDEEPAATTANGSTGPSSTTTTPAAGGTGGHGGSTVPPYTGGYGGPTGGFGPYVNPHFNAAPVTPNTPKVPATNEQIDDRGSPAAFFVAGGIIGYLIGRRRGRIKTEKKLLPIQKKLEKQVEDLHWQIKAKESQIRKVAAEKVRQEGPAVVEVLIAKRAAKAESTAETTPVSYKSERIKEGRQRAPEANILHTTTAPEHIGQMLMSAEIPAAVFPRTERQTVMPGKIELKQTAEKAPPALNEKTVETLNRAQLLQLSEQIIVEGSSLRQIYETHLVGEKGLRRLVIEHLRGGDMGKALKREITEREIDFERDPVMRDIASTGSTPTGSAGGTNVGGQVALNQMLEKATASLPASSEEAAFYKARAAYELNQSGKQKQRQRIIDVSFGGVIFILLGAVVYLFITRG